MGAPREPFWEYVVPGTKARHVKCVFCAKEMFNPTWLKKHIVGLKYKPSRNVKIELLKRIVLSGRRGKDDEYAAERASVEADEEPAAKRGRITSDPGFCYGSTGSAGGTLENFVRVMSWKESKAIDGICAKWIYRRAMPLNTTSSPDFIALARALNPEYCPPTRYSLAGPLLDQE